MEKKITLRRIWHGDMNYPFFIRFVIIVLTFFVGMLLILLAVIDGSFRMNAISNLGDPTILPNWWWILTVLYGIMAILLVPYIRVMYRVLYSPVKCFKILWALLMSMSIFGLTATGIFNETMGLVHIISAVFAFGGLGFGFLLSLVFLLFNVITHHESIVASRVLILFLVMGICIAVGLNEIITYGVSDPMKLNFLEWIALFTLVIWLILLPWVHNWKN
jgi:hypothetical protein